MEAIENLAEVRNPLKKAGLPVAHVQASQMVVGYSACRRSGFKLKKQTRYRGKYHEPTGRVLVDFLLRAFGTEEEAATLERQRERAIKVLREQGFAVHTIGGHLLVEKGDRP